MFFTYTETKVKKGTDHVVSMLNYYIDNYLDASVDELKLFYDSP